MIGEAQRHHREPGQLQLPVPDPVQPGDRQHVSGHRGHHEDRQLQGDLGHGPGVRGDQAEDLRGGDRVAVVGVVEQEPAARGPGQRDQPPAVGEEGPQPHSCAACHRPVAVDLPAGETRYRARRLRGPALHLGLVARRFRHPAAQVDHGGGGYRAEREQDPPGHVVTDAGAEQGQRDQRPDDQPERLRAEHHPDQLAAVLPVRVLAHHDCADRVVAADTEPEQESEPDQHPERAGQRRSQRPGDHEHGDQPVHPLAADHVRVAAEHQAPRNAAASIVLLSTASWPEPRCQSLVISAEAIPMTNRS